LGKRRGSTTTRDIRGLPESDEAMEKAGGKVSWAKRSKNNVKQNWKVQKTGVISEKASKARENLEKNLTRTIKKSTKDE